jgi:uncharacterized RDD family membrane protein YckC
MESKYPTLLSRIQSITIDTLLLIGFMAFFTIMLDGHKNVPDSLRMWLFISLVMYEPLCTTFGATFGNYKLGIRVRKNSDQSRRINIFQALARYFFKTIFGWISFFGVFTNAKKRAFHDILSGSVMITEK